MKLSEIDKKNKNSYKSLDEVYLGARAIFNINKELFKDNPFAKRCRNDYLKVLVDLSSEIRKIFTCTENGIILKLRVSYPKFESDHNPTLVTMATLAAHFSSINAEHEINELDD